MEQVVTRWGFKSRTQLPIFMVWREYRYRGRVELASVVFSTGDWRRHLRGAAKWFVRRLLIYAAVTFGGAILLVIGAYLYAKFI